MSNLGILLIIYNHDLRQLYHEILVSEHWQTFDTSTITDALVYLVIHHTIKVIILDTQFPHSELILFLKSLHSKLQWRSLPICFLDADLNEPLPEELIKLLPATAFVSTHQTAPDKLIETLKGLL